MKTHHQQLPIRVITDRTQYFAWGKTDEVPVLPGFHVSRDFRVRQQTKVRTCSRVNISENERTGTKAYLQYEPSAICKSPMKLTLIPVDETGLLPAEAWRIEKVFRRSRPLRLEVALDFSPMSDINSAYVDQHGRFGRAKICRKESDSFRRRGSRRGDILIRIYEKLQTRCFRIELELHSRWLRRHGIRRISDFQYLPALLVPRHFQFVDFDLDKLANYLRHAAYDAEEIVAQCRRREKSLHLLITYLRRHLGLVNTHRFLRPLPINRDIKRALRVWAAGWVRPEEGS